MTEQVYKPRVEFRILFTQSWLFLSLSLSCSDRRALWIYDMTMTSQLHKATSVFLGGIFSFLWQHIVFTDVTWMHLALPNWPGIGAVKMCVQPWAVSSQHTNDAPFGILCPRPDTVQEQKACWTPCWNKEIFLKALVQSVWNVSGRIFLC